MSGGAPVASHRTRHCWVRDPDAQGEWPGLVLEWRKQGESWLALVVYLPTEGPQMTTVQEWLNAERLRPVDD